MEKKENIIIDPSTLTTQQLWREISSLKELIEARISAIEKGIEVAHEDMVRVPTEIMKQVGGLKELMETKINTINILREEKFAKVEQRFTLIEAQRVEQKNDTTKAVESALHAAKELFDLQNESFTKQVDDQAIFIQKSVQGLEDKIADNKDRLTRIEGIAAGSLTSKTESRTTSMNTASIISISIGAVVGLVGLVLLIISFSRT